MNESYLLQLPSGAQYSYRVIKSKRAKYIRIKLSNLGELSVVVPKRVSLQHGHQFIHRKSDWIERNLKNISPQSAQVLPDLMDLKLLGEQWSIDYIKQNDYSIVKLYEKPAYMLELRGNIEETVLIKKAINKWCQKKAKLIFSIMLEQLAEKHGFHYRRLSIRSQKTRWGSCSADKNISLNSKLLFMTESVVQYVMIHELCHTIEMNHSKRFWDLVGECDPDYLANRKHLKTQGKLVFL